MPEQRTEPQRYEPLPGFLDLPGWLWRKTPRPGRFGLVAAVIALIVTGIAAACGAANPGRTCFLANGNLVSGQTYQFRVFAKTASSLGQMTASFPYTAP